MALTDFQKDSICEKVVESSVRCNKCIEYVKEKQQCNLDCYDGRDLSDCFSGVYQYLDKYDLWERTAKLHRVKLENKCNCTNCSCGKRDKHYG